MSEQTTTPEHTMSPDQVLETIPTAWGKSPLQGLSDEVLRLRGLLRNNPETQRRLALQILLCDLALAAGISLRERDLGPGLLAWVKDAVPGSTFRALVVERDALRKKVSAYDDLERELVRCRAELIRAQSRP